MNATAGQAQAEVRAERRRRYTHKTVTVDVDINVDEVLESCTDEQLVEELESRRGAAGAPHGLLKIFEHFQRCGGAPDCLRDYFYEHLGRVL